jgi:hypothetical protein
VAVLRYHLGGHDAAAPAQNRAEQWDTVTGYTRWSKAGAVLEQRPLSAEEAAHLAAQEQTVTVDANSATLRDRAAQALAANRTYLNAAKPGTAALQASAAYDQSKALTRQMNALIRLTLGQLDATD